MRTKIRSVYTFFQMADLAKSHKMAVTAQHTFFFWSVLGDLLLSHPHTAEQLWCERGMNVEL